MAVIDGEFQQVPKAGRGFYLSPEAIKNKLQESASKKNKFKLKKLFTILRTHFTKN